MPDTDELLSQRTDVIDIERQETYERGKAAQTGKYLVCSSVPLLLLAVGAGIMGFQRLMFTVAGLAVALIVVGFLLIADGQRQGRRRLVKSQPTK